MANFKGCCARTVTAGYNKSLRFPHGDDDDGDGDDDDGEESEDDGEDENPLMMKMS